MTNSLDDLYYFSGVVANGGFSAASRALKQPTSKLSRRVSDLEERLGVRLIERTTRRFRVTDVGQRFYVHCRNMLLEAEKAHAVAVQCRDECSGTVRFSVPYGMSEHVVPAIASFVMKQPHVRVEIDAASGSVDLIEKRIDVALRIMPTLTDASNLKVRQITNSRRILVATPAIASNIQDASSPLALADLPTVALASDEPPDQWDLVGPGGQMATICHSPRVESRELTMLKAAAEAGVGIALLPQYVCHDALVECRLAHVLPDWYREPDIVYLVFTTSRGLPPAVRAFIDHVTECLKENIVQREPTTPYSAYCTASSRSHFAGENPRSRKQDECSYQRAVQDRRIVVEEASA